MSIAVVVTITSFLYEGLEKQRLVGIGVLTKPQLPENCMR